jgi:hypothetical protein
MRSGDVSGRANGDKCQETPLSVFVPLIACVFPSNAAGSPSTTALLPLLASAPRCLRDTTTATPLIHHKDKSPATRPVSDLRLGLRRHPGPRPSSHFLVRGPQCRLGGIFVAIFPDKPASGESSIKLWTRVPKWASAQDPNSCDASEDSKGTCQRHLSTSIFHRDRYIRSQLDETPARPGPVLPDSSDQSSHRPG